MSKEKGTVNIHGKEYETVASRVQKFRSDKTYEGYAILTEIVYRDSDEVVVKAIIKNADDRTIATGYAEEKRSASQINKTSAVENGETSAIGRALANLGLAGTEYASADEVAEAIKQQNAPQKVTPAQKKRVNDLMELQGVETSKDKLELLEELTGKKSMDGMTSSVASELISKLEVKQ